MLALLAVAVVFGVARLPASELSVLCVLAVGLALAVAGWVNAGYGAPLHRLCYGAALMAYIVGLPWLTAELSAHYQVAPAPLAWLLPLLYLGVLPLELLLMPLLAHRRSAAHWLRRRRRG